MHLHYTYDKRRGDVTDVATLCSDACNKEYAANNYEGWNGCHEAEFTTYCVNCGVVIPAEDSCECQHKAAILCNRFLHPQGEKCAIHGNWLQLPSQNLETERG